MSERRSHRGIHRTDQQILGHADDMALLTLVQRQAVVMSPELRSDLRRLALDDLILVGFGMGAAPILLPRGERLLAVARGEYALPRD